jgi:uncharacterized protein YeaO (DUF488 family)
VSSGATRLKRAYLAADDGDGMRVLVDRLWPRGVSKAEAKIDLWAKEAAPSAALRQWFGHRPTRWPEFRRRYLDELQDNPQIETLRTLARRGVLTLVYAAKDETHNNAVVLAA